MNSFQRIEKVVRLPGNVASFGTRMAAFLLLDLFFSVPSSAQNISGAIDTLMRTLAARGQFNGSVLVAEHGRMIYEGGFGVADSEHGIPFSPETPCYLASLTKQFTAMAVMMLEERHKLSYDDSLLRYIPEFPAYARGVTIGHLLHHTSGIADYTRLGLERPGLTNGDVLKALQEQDSLQFPPGERFEYSNSGYILLALIIEKVSGLPFRTFLEKNIFGPLGMKNTYLYDESRPKIPGRARGYNRFGAPADYDLCTAGEGGMYSSVRDMFAWDQALYAGKLVHESTLARAFQRGRLTSGDSTNYGFGWAIGNLDGQVVYSHAGRYGGFNTYIRRFPSTQSTIIFLTNHDFKNMGAIGNPLTNLLFRRRYVLPKRSAGELMFSIVSSEGLSAALDRYRAIRSGGDTTYDFGESELNELGYEYLGRRMFTEAIALLDLNAREYPSSWNVYDGLGEAYLDSGNNDLAILNYKKSLELNPGNHGAENVLRRLGVR